MNTTQLLKEDFVETLEHLMRDSMTLQALVRGLEQADHLDQYPAKIPLECILAQCDYLEQHILDLTHMRDSILDLMTEPIL